MMLEGAAGCFGDQGNTNALLSGKYAQHRPALKRRFQQRQGAEGAR